jgi:hypothetical protein
VLNQGGADGHEEMESGPEGQSQQYGKSTAKAEGRKRRKKKKQERDKTTKREETEVSKQFRSTMIMGETYTGVTCFLPPGTNRCGVMIEGTLLQGFAYIPAGRLCILEQTVKVRMQKLPDAAFPDAKALQLEFV